jgi:glycosyltransferase involved in cell wall biosynthesis
MISIIIPIYNQTDKLSSCLDSILKQSYKDYEIIIVNDGSTDNVEKIIEKYKNKLQAIHQQNKGANSARNRGAKEAKGEYLLFCDADVEMEPDMLAIMLKTLEKNSQASFAYSGFKFGFKTFKSAPYSAERLKQAPYIHTMALIRREHFPQFSAQGGPASGWDESLKKFQDWDLWLTMLGENHTGIWVDKILFKVKTGGTMSSWLPSFAYKLMPFLPSVKRYKKAMEIIKQKHNL